VSGSPEVVGFVGLGEQGEPLARNLLYAGFDTVAFDRRPEACAAFAGAGGRAAGSPAEVAAEAAVVLVCVLEDAQLLDVIEGERGLLAEMRPGGVIVVNSTVSPEAIRRIGVAAGEKGVEVVDAPLTGGPSGAVNRTVVYFVGGRDGAVAKCRHLLEVSAARVIRAGGPGAGARAKLVHQLILCGNLLAAREGWVLGLRAGLDEQVILDVICSGAAQSRIAERLPGLTWAPHVTHLFRKDLGLCLELGAQLGVALPNTTSSEQMIEVIATGH
jgi:3-hydroxyisobutyrate dehydrogenase-like beta-hydroxyacid dehydrogenase